MIDTISVLVATATPGFGELIQQTLEETGLYKVLLVDSSAEALQCAQAMPFSLSILDLTNPEISPVELAASLRQHLPELRLIAIPPDNRPENPLLAEIGAQAWLMKPFYLPELLEVISNVVRQPPLPPAESAGLGEQPQAAASPEWLEDVSLAAQHLASLSLASSAQAALIVRDGQPWAYAGQLSQPASQELAQMVVRFWDHDRPAPGAPDARPAQGSDIVRFVRLEVNRKDYMLYATSLGKGMLLALAFDAETPFSTIRAQAGNLARALGSPGAKPSPVAVRPTARPASRPVSASQPPAHQNAPVRPLLEDVPPPTPRLPTPTPTPLPAIRATLAPRPAEEPLQPPQPSIANIELNPAPTSSDPPTRPVPSTPALPSLLDEEAEPEPIEIVLRPATPTLAGLYFACLLIPRLPQHHLTGDLSAQLSEWIRQLSLAYAWRLERIAIRPDHMQWTVSIPPNISPSYMMRIIRQHTSNHIFANFPALGRENPSGDFWAPGYLIMSSHQLPPEETVREFIQQTRHQQGAPKVNTRPLPPG